MNTIWNFLLCPFGVHRWTSREMQKKEREKFEGLQDYRKVYCTACNMTRFGPKDRMRFVESVMEDLAPQIREIKEMEARMSPEALAMMNDLYGSSAGFKSFRSATDRIIELESGNNQ